MKVIIAGSRDIIDFVHVMDAIMFAKFDITEVVSGGAVGVDQNGEQWATDCDIPVKKFPADWNQFGKSAGYKRNVQMAEYADALLAVWDGFSRGTNHMIDIMNKKGKPVFIYQPDESK